MDGKIACLYFNLTKVEFQKLLLAIEKVSIYIQCSYLRSNKGENDEMHYPLESSQHANFTKMLNKDRKRSKPSLKLSCKLNSGSFLLSSLEKD